MATENPIPIPRDMAHLADQFRSHLLKFNSNSLKKNPVSNSYSTDTNSSDSYGWYEEYHHVNISNPTVDRLRRIATAMSAAGYLHECIHIYASEQSKRFINIKNLSLREVGNLYLESFKSFIHDWNRSAHILFHVRVEKKLCEHIFQDLENGDACFVKTVKGPVTRLFDNAEAVCSVDLSLGMIFRFLDLYKTLSTLLPLISDLFSSESMEFIRLRPAQLLPKVGQLIRRILSDFERDVLQEKSPTLLPAPVIHLHTMYVLSFVIDLCGICYKQTLMTVIESRPDSTDEVGVLEYDEGRTPLSLHLIWIIMQLLSNLEAKSKHYKEKSMPEFFILINVDYIVGKIKESQGLREMIGDRYLIKLADKLGQAKADYLGICLGKLLYCLRAEGLNGKSGMFSSKAKRMTKRLKKFNDRFEKVQRDLEKLLISDWLLLVDIRKSISEKLIPAYSSFLEQLKNITGGKRKHSVEKHIKYSVQELKTAVQGLYKRYHSAQDYLTVSNILLFDNID